MALFLCVTATSAAEGPRVVASITPVHSLVAGVMVGIGEPTLLIAGGASPHSYSLRPSEASALEKADAIFWVGHGLETFLSKALLALGHRARVVALSEAEGVSLLASREGGRFTTGAGEDYAAGASHSHTHEDHGHGGQNLHIWLDPVNASAMVSEIVATLAEVDPDNATRYKENGATLQERLARLDGGMHDTLAPLEGRPYVVLHDAYPYLERRYGLTPVAAISVSPDRRPSARRLFEIRKLIAESGAVCVFSEPQFEPAVVATVVEGSDARTGVLDPLGADVAPGPDAYFVLMRALADSLRQCL